MRCFFNGPQCMLLNANVAHVCDIFTDIRQCFRPAQTKGLKNQKFNHILVILDNIWYF